jgi:hypothetical protein
MSWLKQTFNFYLDASIHVAFAVASLYFVTLKITEGSTNWYLAGFLFFGTIVCYNFIKFGVEAEKYLIVSNPYHKIIQTFSFLAFALAGYCFFQLESEVWIAIFILMGVSVLYAIPLLPSTKNLRSFAGLKTFLVALVWMGCTVLLPVIDNQLEITWDIAVLMGQRFLLVLVLLLPFEIRDMVHDKPELRTLPQRIGIAKTKVLGYILTLFYFLLSFLKDELTSAELLSKALVCLVLLIALKQTKKKQHSYFSSFWVEGVPMFYLLIIYLANQFWL